ncbi:MAG: RsmE family RNA methyltransferase [Gemmatimonadota bacterium]
MGGGRAADVITVVSAPGSLAAGAHLVLDDAESHHLSVRRAAEGEQVRVLDGAGTIGTGALRLQGKRRSILIDTVQFIDRPARTTLAVGAGDRDRFALLVEKSVELGATDIFPLETERTASVNSRVRASALDRLRDRANEALKQCGNPWAPAVHEPISLLDFVGRESPGLRWVGAPEGAPPPGKLSDEAVTVVIGPEGGLNDAERDLLHQAGYLPISFGTHVLRFETAALAALAGIAAARHRGAHV